MCNNAIEFVFIAPEIDLDLFVSVKKNCKELNFRSNSRIRKIFYN